jgi:hypothetical protein
MIAGVSQQEIMTFTARVVHPPNEGDRMQAARRLARRVVAVRRALDRGRRVPARPHPGTAMRCDSASKKMRPTTTPFSKTL